MLHGSLSNHLRYPKAKLARFYGIARRFRRDQRGGVALIVAICLIPLVMAVGIGVEASNWIVVKIELQRTVDLAALAGAKEYLRASDTQNTVNAAADVAEFNGGLGGTSRTWDSNNQLLTDNQITAQITSGTRQRPSVIVKVVARQTVPLVFTSVMGATSPVAIVATGWADASIPVQPCVYAMDSGGAGITSQGSVSVNLTGCSMRSNAAISTGGSGTMSAAGFYAGGSITGNETGGPLFPYDGTISDPYANYSPVQDALSQLGSPSGPVFNDKPGITTPLVSGAPKVWSNWNIQGSVVLAAGIYYVKGDITLGDSASLSSLLNAGVTIVMGGVLKMNGGSTISLSAATKAVYLNGAIPGVVFAGNSSNGSSFNGNTGTKLTGVVYYPNGALNFGGTSQGGTAGCLEVIAKSVQLQGNSSMAAKCADYGVLGFPSETSTSALVQ